MDIHKRESVQELIGRIIARLFLCFSDSLFPAFFNDHWDYCAYFDFSMKANTRFSFLFVLLGMVVEDSGSSKVGDIYWHL